MYDAYVCMMCMYVYTYIHICICISIWSVCMICTYAWLICMVCMICMYDLYVWTVWVYDLYDLYVWYLSMICMYAYIHVLYVCMYDLYMYLWSACRICMYDLYVWPVCMTWVICMIYIRDLHVCMCCVYLCMHDMCVYVYMYAMFVYMYVWSAWYVSKIWKCICMCGLHDMLDLYEIMYVCTVCVICSPVWKYVCMYDLRDMFDLYVRVYSYDCYECVYVYMYYMYVVYNVDVRMYLYMYVYLYACVYINIHIAWSCNVHTSSLHACMNTCICMHATMWAFMYHCSREVFVALSCNLKALLWCASSCVSWHAQSSRAPWVASTGGSAHARRQLTDCQGAHVSWAVPRDTGQHGWRTTPHPLRRSHLQEDCWWHLATHCKRVAHSRQDAAARGKMLCPNESSTISIITARSIYMLVSYELCASWNAGFWCHVITDNSMCPWISIYALSTNSVLWELIPCVRFLCMYVPANCCTAANTCTATYRSKSIKLIKNHCTHLQKYPRLPRADALCHSPCAMCSVLCALCPVPCALCPVPLYLVPCAHVPYLTCHGPCPCATCHVLCAICPLAWAMSPCTLCHVPCAMSPAPCAMFHMPWALHPVPCAMRHAPYAMCQCAYTNKPHGYTSQIWLVDPCGLLV